MTQELTVQDMTCNGCAATVRKAISQVPGVQEVTVDLATHAVRVNATDGVATETIANAIRGAGYTPSSAATPKQIPTIALVGDSGSTCGDGCCS